MSEKLGDPALLADAHNRLAVTMQVERPEQAIETLRRALTIYQTLGDRRGQARCHNNIGIIFSRRNDWPNAQRAFTTAMSLARTAGAPDMWGLAGLNLGVSDMLCGEYDRARELFGEALAVFATVKYSERQLYALFNLAHLDRERGVYDSAAELYEVAASLAQRIGQLDVEIGALAGAGLSLLKQGKLDAARVAFLSAEERMSARPDWFQGRELVEALSVAIAAADERLPAAVQRFEEAVALAEANDLYCAAWLTVECAALLMDHDPDRIRPSVTRYVDRVKSLGLEEMNRRYAALLART